MNSRSGIEDWNRRFAGDAFLFGDRPNAFLARQKPLLPPGGAALALADGEGRNGVWLAEQGLQVTAVDGSSVALAKAAGLARARGVALTFVEADLDTWKVPENAYDVVVGIFFQFAPPDLRSRLFAAMETALKPGGLLLIEGYGVGQLEYGTGGPRNRDHLYTEAMLREAFAGLRIETLEAYDAEVDEGTGHKGMSALVDLVARKPPAP